MLRLLSGGLYIFTISISWEFDCMVIIWISNLLLLLLKGVNSLTLYVISLRMSISMLPPLLVLSFLSFLYTSYDLKYGVLFFWLSICFNQVSWIATMCGVWVERSTLRSESLLLRLRAFHCMICRLLFKAWTSMMTNGVGFGFLCSGI